jgi:histidinol phosphatase-like enzyme
MLIRAAADLDLDLSGSFMIGDSDSDLEAGRRAGCIPVKVPPCDGALLAVVRQITSLSSKNTPAAAEGGTP